MSVDHDFMVFVMREARGTIAAVGEREVDPDAIAGASVIVGIDTALRAAVMDPAGAERLRDALTEIIHRAPGADPGGEHHANAAALKLLELVR